MVHSARRKVWVGLPLGLLVISMFVSIRRGSRGVEISEGLADLGRQEQTMRDRMASEMIRTDSLESRERILTAAAALGLRPATEREIRFLPSAGGGPASRREAP